MTYTLQIILLAKCSMPKEVFRIPTGRPYKKRKNTTRSPKLYRNIEKNVTLEEMSSCAISFSLFSRLSLLLFSFLALFGIFSYNNAVDDDADSKGFGRPEKTRGVFDFHPDPTCVQCFRFSGY